MFSSWQGGTNIFELEGQDLDGSRLLMLNMDPPQHAKFRRLVSKGFTPKRITMLREHIRALARSIIDRIAERGECEFVSEVAAQVPMQTICEMIGVPESDRQYVYDVSNKLIGFDDPDFQTSFEEGHLAAAELYMYADGLGEEKKKCPMDDLATTLIHAEVDGEKLTDQEFQSFFLLLAIAGNETTRTVSAQGMRLLSAHPEVRNRVAADLALLPRAVEEILRYNPAVIHFRRTATEDVELRGKKIRKGDKVVVWYPSANRDEEVYGDPEKFDIDRWPNDHLAFGVGEHFCLGASLARLQLNSIFGEILTRLPDIEVDGPVRYLRSNFIDGIKEMRVRFTPESQRRRAAS
jgi:cholest-4-en-3-one 26-monooxygenase